MMDKFWAKAGPAAVALLVALTVYVYTDDARAASQNFELLQREVQDVKVEIETLKAIVIRLDVLMSQQVKINEQLVAAGISRRVTSPD